MISDKNHIHFLYGKPINITNEYNNRRPIVQQNIISTSSNSHTVHKNAKECLIHIYIFIKNVEVKDNKSEVII